MIESRIAVMTDSNSGITAEEAEWYNIHVLAMPLLIESNLYYEGNTISQIEFYKKMNQGVAISTSLPSIADLKDSWNHLLDKNDAVLYIPMSKYLSSSYSIACAAAAEYNGKVCVIDSCRISLPLKELVFDAHYLVNTVSIIENIVEALESTKQDSTIFITVATFKYLKRGGRVSNSAAFAGETLGIRPILRMNGGEFELFQKVRTITSGRKRMLAALAAEIDHIPQIAANRLCLQVAYSGTSETEATILKAELSGHYPDQDIQIEPLTLSIASHVGPGAIGIGFTKKLSK